METAKKLLQLNKEWAEQIASQNPNYFEELSRGQHPKVLWIGCADSRVPAEIITKSAPGEIFVHRNIANVVNSADLNLLSVIDYAVNALKVIHIIVCGHYFCGGVKAAIDRKNAGIVENWIIPIRSTFHKYKKQIENLPEQEQWNKLVELHVIEQVNNLTKLPVVQSAWKQNRPLLIHGWVFNIKTGKIKDLNVSKTGLQDIPKDFIIS